MVLNAAVLLPPREMEVLQILHVATRLLSFSKLKYFHTADILSKGVPE